MILTPAVVKPYIWQVIPTQTLTHTCTFWQIILFAKRLELFSLVVHILCRIHQLHPQFFMLLYVVHTFTLLVVINRLYCSCMQNKIQFTVLLFHLNCNYNVQRYQYLVPVTCPWSLLDRNLIFPWPHWRNGKTMEWNWGLEHQLLNLEVKNHYIHLCYISYSAFQVCCPTEISTGQLVDVPIL